MAGALGKAVGHVLGAVLTAYYRLSDLVTGSCRECGLRQQVHVRGCSRIVKYAPVKNSTNSADYGKRGKDRNDW